MEIISTIVGVILVILIYTSNRRNKVNKWGALACLFFWLGGFKEIYLVRIMPYLENTLNGAVSHDILTIPYSLLSWVANILSMPAAVITSLYLYGMDIKNPKRMRRIGILLFVSVLILLFLLPPFSLYELEMSGSNYWYLYAVHDITLGVVFAFFMVKSVLSEKSGIVRMQKLLVVLITFPTIIYALIAIFIIRTLELNDWFILWAGITFIFAMGILLYIYMAFRNGMMGLKLSKDAYNWTSDMNLINKGAEYTSHILKNQTDKMEWCIENLKVEYNRSNSEMPDELLILSRSLSALKTNMNKIRKHSEVISLYEETVNLKELFENSISFPNETVEIHLYLPDDIYFLCDKTHISEVFTNIISNAYEAIKSKKNTGIINITGKYDEKKRFYLVRFTDDGVGMSNEDIENMFKPYFTTKNTEKNFGLGLAYCKNVIDKHEGYIKAESKLGEGTAVIIALPEKRINGGQNV